MQALYELLRDLERGAHARGVARSEILARVTTLFATRERRLQDEEAVLFDRVFTNLVEDADVTARRALAEALAASPRAPAGVVEMLASDPDAAVAEPLLERSLVVHTQTLVKLASTRSERHQLAIARRAAIAAPVSRALAERGTQDVRRTLAQNDGAIFDEASFAILADRARADIALVAALCARGDLPNQHYTDLLAIDFAAACEAFDEEYGALELLGVDVIPIVVAAMTDASRNRYDAAALKASLDYVRWRMDTGAFRIAHVARWLARNQHEDVVAALALSSGLPAETVQRLCFAASPLPASMLFKALGLDFETLKQFLRAHDPEGLALDEQVEVFDVFDSISEATARHVVRHAALCVRVRAAF